LACPIADAVDELRDFHPVIFLSHRSLRIGSAYLDAPATGPAILPGQ
jgi:hypothetical protein